MAANTLQLKRITVEGFKSFRSATLELRPLNVLIGANGAGKSNFVSFLQMVRKISKIRLQSFIGKSGGASSLLHYSKAPMRAVFEFGPDPRCIYDFTLARAPEDTLVFDREVLQMAHGSKVDGPQVWDFESGHRETRLNAPTEREYGAAAAAMLHLWDWGMFHFLDTSPSARVRQNSEVHDRSRLHSDAGNLAAVLYKYKRLQPQSNAYWRIVKTVQQIAPWFGDFVLEPSELNEDKILLRWQERDSELVFGPHMLSDGTLRAIALVTLLLQPVAELPSLLVIDEPELGLHPYALDAITGLLRAASLHCQIVVATQSPRLVDLCEPEDVVVVEREGGESTFVREGAERLKEWLEEYSLGELWEKNVIGGGPV